MQLGRDWREFIESLNANGVRYLVVGGCAVAAHGHPRYTKDLDVWLAVTPENARRVLQTLADFGFEGAGIGMDDLMTPERVIQLGYPPQRIDLLTSLVGVEFDECYQARVVIKLDGTPVNFIDVDNLIRNKRAAGRYQDLADVENLLDDGPEPAS